MQYANDNPRASIPVSPATAARLDWLPIPITDAKVWASDLSDHETGWFWNLIFASLAAKPQGYLLNSSNLWMIAGARRSDFWESHKSRVLARFEVREMDGMQMLWFPPLVEIVTEQLRKLRSYRPRSASLSLSHDSALEDQNQKQRERDTRKKKEATHESGATGRTTPLDRFISG